MSAQLVLMCAARIALAVQVDSADAVRAALDSHDYRRAEALMGDVAIDARPLLDARLHFEVGDFVGCTRIASAALSTTPTEQHRELAWWGAKAALWLQDAPGAQAWTARLSEASVGDAAWESIARDYAALGAQLSRGSSDERRALATSRWTVAIMVLLTCAGTVRAFWREASN